MDPYKLPRWIEWLNANPILRAVLRARAKRAKPHFCSACGKVIMGVAILPGRGLSVKEIYHSECCPFSNPFPKRTDFTPPNSR
jgi:hypothetical protein